MSENNQDKTHFRKAFKSPYLSSADIEDPIILTVAYARLEADKTKRSKEQFNTVYFVEKEIRKGEILKPMILNATNSKRMKAITGSGFLEDWAGAKVMIYVNPAVMNRGEIVEGLRIKEAPKQEKRMLTPSDTGKWSRAKNSFIKTGSLDKVKEHLTITPEHEAQLIAEANNDLAQHQAE